MERSQRSQNVPKIQCVPARNFTQMHITRLGQKADVSKTRLENTFAQHAGSMAGEENGCIRVDMTKSLLLVALGQSQAPAAVPAEGGLAERIHQASCEAVPFLGPPYKC